jgi:hypothetical protein
VETPGQTLQDAAISATTANPVPLVAQVVTNAKGTASGAKTDAAQQMREKAVDKALGKQGTGRNQDDAERCKVPIAVIAPGYKAVKGDACAYWMEPAETPDHKPAGPRACLGAIKLAAEASKNSSEIGKEAIVLSDPHLDPPLAVPGTPVKLSVKLQMPSEPAMHVRVFAREAKTRKVVELTTQKDGLYTGELLLDPKIPRGDTKICIAALRAEPVEVKLPQDKPDPLPEFVHRLEEMDAAKPYAFDPRVMASENRIDLPLTVLDPKQATPPAAPEKGK